MVKPSTKEHYVLKVYKQGSVSLGCFIEMWK